MSKKHRSHAPNTWNQKHPVENMETRKQHPTSARGVGRVRFLVLLLAAAFIVWLSQVSDLVAPPQPTSEGAAETHSPVAWDELLHASEPCASGINVLWILSNPHDTWGSSLWSGWEIAEAISKSFFLFLIQNLIALLKLFIISFIIIIYC